jgi:hypothetical protein
MLARVLIVIVVVAVLGFFGTRGSEKVVEEVTTRQAVVDTQGKRLDEVTARMQKIEVALAAAEKQRAEDARQRAQQEEELRAEIARLETKIAELRALQGEDARLALTTFPFGPVTLDGKTLSRSSKEETLRVKRGAHDIVLTDPATRRKARWKVTLNSDHPENRLVLLINGQAETRGDVEATSIKN